MIFFKYKILLNKARIIKKMSLNKKQIDQYCFFSFKNCLKLSNNKSIEIKMPEPDLFSNLYLIPEIVSLILEFSENHERGSLFLVSKYFLEFQNIEPFQSQRKKNVKSNKEKIMNAKNWNELLEIANQWKENDLRFGVLELGKKSLGINDYDEFRSRYVPIHNQYILLNEFSWKCITQEQLKIFKIFEGILKIYWNDENNEDDEFNLKLTKEYLPSSLTFLSFGFRNRTDLKKLPTSITILELRRTRHGFYYKNPPFPYQRLYDIQVIKSIKTVIFIDAFLGVIKNCLKLLDVETICFFSMNENINGYLANGIKYLELGKDYLKEIKDVPDSIEIITLDNTYPLPIHHLQERGILVERKDLF